ncbi:MAG: N-acetyltransferase [Rickettsiales bacterium]|nr:MAG: N-acetyltransferase [Rickettsiales bacterium]
MIRKGKITDLIDLQKIMKSSLGFWQYSENDMIELIKHLNITETFINDAIIYVEENEGKIEGFFGIIPYDDLNEAKFYINPSNIKTGIGKRLWHHVIQDLEKMELDYITIIIDGNAIGFYEKLGFIKIGEQPSKLNNVNNESYTPIMRYYLKK